MLNFESDYVSGCHPRLLDALAKSNNEIVSGYGKDCFTGEACMALRSACGDSDADIEFVSGGTQANQLVIASLLDKFEGVVCPDTGHINHHEAGAIEFTNHKVIEMPSNEGKIDIQCLKSYFDDFFSCNHEQRVAPGVVCIAYPTEMGTLYSYDELKEISSLCHNNGVKLYIDGARLGYALAAECCDVTLNDLCNLSDAFYIGGTKCGALCGEAIVFPQGKRPLHFTTYKKQHGALMAKNRLLAVQFTELFKDGLYFRISENAIRCADLMKKVFRKHGIDFFVESPTNQQFVILDKNVSEKLKTDVCFKFWKNYGNEKIVARFVTSWSTSEDQIAQLDELLEKATK